MSWLIAFYGSLRAGSGVLDRVCPRGSVALLGPCVIRGRLYDLGPYPGLVAGRGRVLGDLYRIRRPSVLAGLDAYEDCDPDHPARSLYLRRRVRLVRPGVWAWVYVYTGSVRGCRKIIAGDWLTAGNCESYG